MPEFQLKMMKKKKKKIIPKTETNSDTLSAMQWMITLLIWTNKNEWMNMCTIILSVKPSCTVLECEFECLSVRGFKSPLFDYKFVLFYFRYCFVFLCLNCARNELFFPHFFSSHSLLMLLFICWSFVFIQSFLCSIFA